MAENAGFQLQRGAEPTVQGRNHRSDVRSMPAMGSQFSQETIGDRDRKQQGVGVGHKGGTKAGSAEFLVEPAARVTSSRMDRVVVSTSHPIVRGNPYEKGSVWAKHPRHLGHRQFIILDGTVVDDIEGRHEIERVDAEGQVGNGSSCQWLRLAEANKLECFVGYVDAESRPKPTKIGKHSTRPAPCVENQEVFRPAKETVYERQSDVTHSNEPPQTVLELVQPSVFFFLH